MNKALFGGIALCSLLAAGAPAQSEDSDSESVERTNSRLDPNAVRCERRPVVGSRYRTVRVCLTNAQWDQIFNDGNRDANRLIDDNRPIYDYGG